MEQAMNMARIAYEALADKKGEDIKVLDISEISPIADYFVISNGTSSSQVDALVDNVEEKMHKAGYSLKQQEGTNSGTWVLMDYGDIIVHIFDKENRSFYNLEHIWSDEIYGIVTCSDSLYAIKKCVYDEQCITAETLMESLKADFKGYEDVRAILLNVDKFGNDLEEVDNMMKAVHEMVCYTMLDISGKYYGLDCFGMVNINNRDNTTYGRNTGATPDGRHAGESLTNANNPTAGMDKNGVTAFINSLLKARSNIHFGTVQNMKFSKETFNDMRHTIIYPLLDSYFSRGGTQTMINVVGRDDLENARKEPEKYSNLIVRVGGFSARYVELADDVQLDILNRTLN